MSIKQNYFFTFGRSKSGSDGNDDSPGLPNQTDLLKRPFITGACHLVLHIIVVVGFSAVIAAVVTTLKMQ